TRRPSRSGVPNVRALGPRRSPARPPAGAPPPVSRRRAARRLGTRRSVCSPGPLPHLEPAGGGGPGEVSVGRLPAERPTIPHDHARRGPATAIVGVADAVDPAPTGPGRRSDRLSLGPHR